jgi:hypothetical protein
MPFVVMLIEFGPLDDGSARLNDPAHIAACGQELARDMDRSIAGSRGTRPRQLPGLSEHNVPHHLVWLQIVPALFVSAALRAQVGFRCSAHERPHGCGRTTLWQSHNGQGYWSFQPIAASRRSRSSGNASTRSCARGTAPDCAVVALEGAAECGAGDLRQLHAKAIASTRGWAQARRAAAANACRSRRRTRRGRSHRQPATPRWVANQTTGESPAKPPGASVEKANRLGYIMP